MGIAFVYTRKIRQKFLIINTWTTTQGTLVLADFWSWQHLVIYSLFRVGIINMMLKMPEAAGGPSMLDSQCYEH